MTGGPRPATVDVVYVGFLLGHGGDALQMLQLAGGHAGPGVSVRLVVPAVPESVTFARRCEELGLPCERTDLISVTMSGARQSLRSMLRLLSTLREPVVHFHTGNSFAFRVRCCWPSSYDGSVAVS